MTTSLRHLIAGLLSFALVVLAAGCAPKAPEVRPLLWKDVAYAHPDRTIRAADHEIHYVDVGPREDPEPLVLIHGLGGNLDNWRHTIAAFGKAKRVVAVDLPGFGKSEKKPGVDYGPRPMAGRVAAFMDALGIERAAIAGNSMGGLVTVWIALDHPERAARIVLVDAAGLDEEMGWLTDNILSVENLEKNQWRGARAGEDVIFVETPEGYAAEVERLYHISRTDPTWPAYARTFRSAVEGVFRDNVRWKLGEIETPTLIVWGEEDNLLDIEAAETMHREIDGSLLTVIPACGHVPQWECPRPFNRALANFLRLDPKSLREVAGALPAPRSGDALAARAD